MKNKTILLGMALVTFATLFTSCQKEDITSTSIEEVKTSNLILNPAKITLVDPDLEPQGLVSFPIQVNSNACIYDAYSLSVTSPDIDVPNGNFIVKWYKNANQEVYFIGKNLECVCGFGVRVEVFTDSGVIAAEGSYDLPSCNRSIKFN